MQRALIAAARIALASFLRFTILINASIGLIQVVKALYSFEFFFYCRECLWQDCWIRSSPYCVARIGPLRQNSNKTTLLESFHFSYFCLLQGSFFSLIPKNLEIKTIKARAEFVQLVTSLTACGSAKHFCNDLIMAISNVELWDNVLTNRIISVVLLTLNLYASLILLHVSHCQRVTRLRVQLQPAYLQTFSAPYSPSSVRKDAERAESSSRILYLHIVILTMESRS